MTVDNAPRPRRRTLLKLVVIVVLGLLAVEGAVRLRQYVKYGTSARTIYALEMDEAFGYKLPRPNTGVAGIQIDSRGFRGPEIDVPKPEGRVRLAFLGGSATFCAEVSNNQTTWPHLVAQSVAAGLAPREVDYVNGGVPGFSTKHSLLNLKQRVSPLDPDVIVIYHGTNDLNIDTIEVAEERGLISGSAEDPSWFAKISMAWFLLEKNLRVKERQSRKGKDILDVPLAELSLQFENRLDLLLEEAKAQAHVVALCTFQIKARRDQPEEQQLRNFASSLYYMPYMNVESLFEGFEEYNRVIRAAAERHGVLLIETDGALPGDAEHFFDSVHMTDAGARLMAARVSESLLESGALDRIP